jgi:hypothetical protein
MQNLKKNTYYFYECARCNYKTEKIANIKKHLNIKKNVKIKIIIIYQMKF